MSLMHLLAGMREEMLIVPIQELPMGNIFHVIRILKRRLMFAQLFKMTPPDALNSVPLLSKIQDHNRTYYNEMITRVVELFLVV